MPVSQIMSPSSLKKSIEASSLIQTEFYEVWETYYNKWSNQAAYLAKQYEDGTSPTHLKEAPVQDKFKWAAEDELPPPIKIGMS